ncbi:MAG: sensor histidine kinase [Saprospiraceae bacterium]
MKRVLMHLALWAGYAAVELLANWPHFSDKKELLRQTLFFLPIIAGPFYFVAYVLVPRLLWRERKTAFWAACAAVFLLVLVLRVKWTDWYWYFMRGEVFHMPLSKVSKNLFRDYAVIGFAVALKVIRDWYKKDRMAAALQVEKRDAELQFLRAQIHPHFLFNTLNNLYGLALQQSPNTPDSILRLSGLLDFILYECNAEHIPIRKEIALIRDYIELERLRFGDRLLLEFEHDSPPDSLQIAPLLLLPFVENAFKHGPSATNEPVSIHIRLRTETNRLYFQVENSKPANQNTRENGSKGIGLRNVEKRLELLCPGRYTLKKINGNDIFFIALQLEL